MPTTISLYGGVCAALLVSLLAPRAQAQAVAKHQLTMDLDSARELYNQGRYQEAEQSLASVANRIAGLELAARQKAELLGGIGGLYFGLGRFEEGERHLAESLSLWDRQGLGCEAGCLQVRNNLTALWTETKQFSRARRLGEEMLSTNRSVLDRNPIERVHALHNLATAYYFLDRYQEAERLLRQAIATLDQDGPEDPQTMYVLVTMASVLVRNGKPAQALASAQRARSIGERVFGPDHVVLSRALIAESAAYRSMKRTAEASAAVQKALAIIPDGLGPLQQAAWDEYASVLRQSGRKREAKAAEQHAAQTVRWILYPPPKLRPRARDFRTASGLLR